MVSGLSQRMSYLLEYVTPRTILNETGLTASMQREVIAETYVPTGTIRQWVNSLYQKTTYQNLTAVGFSHSQAFRFDAQLPSDIEDKSATVSNLIANLAGGAAKMSLAKQGIAYDVYEHRGIFEEMQDKVKKGFEYSRKTYEEWQDYPTF
jgi:hypothetical protein